MLVFNKMVRKNQNINKIIGIISIITSLKNQRFFIPKIIKNCFAITILIIFGIIIII